MLDVLMNHLFCICRLGLVGSDSVCNINMILTCVKFNEHVCFL